MTKLLFKEGDRVWFGRLEGVIESHQIKTNGISYNVKLRNGNMLFNVPQVELASYD